MLEDVLDAVAARVSHWDAESRNLYMNRAFREAFGVGSQDLTGHHVAEILGTPWYEKLKVPIDRALAGAAVTVESATIGLDGVRRWHEVRFMPSIDEAGVRRVTVLATDITARKQAEERLAERERRIRLLMDTVGDCSTYMLDAHGMITSSSAADNGSTTDIAAAVVGRHFSSLAAPEDRDGGVLQRQLAEAARLGRVDFRCGLAANDGGRHEAAFSIASVRLEQGTLTGYVAVVRRLIVAEATAETPDPLAVSR